MNFQEYRIEARRTMNSELSYAMQLCNAALGLCGEVGESIESLHHPEAQVINELGDICWYIAWCMELLHIDDLDVVSTSNTQVVVAVAAAKVADHIKKTQCHGHPMTDAIKDDIRTQLSIIHAYVHNRAWWFFVSVDAVYDANIVKLKKRFKTDKGFTREESIARADVQPFETNPTSQFINTAEWVIDSANPCTCRFPHKDSLWYKVKDGIHFLTCGVCGNGFYDERIDHLLAKWNDVNVDAPVE